MARWFAGALAGLLMMGGVACGAGDDGASRSDESARSGDEASLLPGASGGGFSQMGEERTDDAGGNAGGMSDPTESGEPGMTPAQLPQGTDRVSLEAFVSQGHHRQWAAEAAPHDSEGPHGGKVRTFVNSALHASLKSGASSHPVGSAVVKELYEKDGQTLTGYAIDVKATSLGKAEWVFYEGFLPNLGKGGYYFRGTSNFCAGCHSAGEDYVLTRAEDLPSLVRP